MTRCKWCRSLCHTSEHMGFNDTVKNLIDGRFCSKKCYEAYINYKTQALKGSKTSRIEHALQEIASITFEEDDTIKTIQEKFYYILGYQAHVWHNIPVFYYNKKIYAAIKTKLSEGLRHIVTLRKKQDEEPVLDKFLLNYIHLFYNLPGKVQFNTTILIVAFFAIFLLTIFHYLLR